MPSPLLKRLSTALKNPAWICFTWFGINAGIGLIATPARFNAPSSSRTVALDIGREVFTVLNKVELALLVALLVLVRTTGLARRFLLLCGALALIVVVQSAWLLPELAERTRIIVAGDTPPASMAHAIYSVLELIKLGLLLWIGFMALQDRSSTTPSRAG